MTAMRMRGQKRPSHPLRRRRGRYSRSRYIGGIIARVQPEAFCLPRLAWRGIKWVGNVLAPVAKWIERRGSAAKVGGSNPSGCTNERAGQMTGLFIGRFQNGIRTAGSITSYSRRSLLRESSAGSSEAFIRPGVPSISSLIVVLLLYYSYEKL